MATRFGEGASSSVERWLAGLAGPDLTQTPLPHYENGAQHDPEVCPVCNSRLGDAAAQESYDEDYDYYIGGIRLPLWIALIWQVPWRQRLDIFVIGLIVGMVISGFALLWGFVLSQY